MGTQCKIFNQHNFIYAHNENIGILNRWKIYAIPDLQYNQLFRISV